MAYYYKLLLLAQSLEEKTKVLKIRDRPAQYQEKN